MDLSRRDRAEGPGRRRRSRRRWYSPPCRCPEHPDRRGPAAANGRRRPAASAAPAAASWSAVKDGRVVATHGDMQAEVNRGLNCVKGYFLSKIMYGADRLTTPLHAHARTAQFDKDGEFQPVSWDQAFDEMARAVEARAARRRGPRRSACSARASGRSGRAMPPPS